jgi:deferrochelatase/peroxidase EfeB
LPAKSVDLGDIQGLVRFGYKHLTEAKFVLLQIADVVAARVWLGSAPVSTAREQQPPPETALQVAFTAGGLLALGVPPAVVSGFSHEFLVGMAAEPSRSRRLGDVGVNEPAQWLWGGAGPVPHLVAMFFAQKGKLDPWMGTLCDRAWQTAFRVVNYLETSDLEGKEHFGFADGISQPSLDWDLKRPFVADQLTFTNLLALGEFLLGYRNEYGKYTDRPLVALGERGKDELPAAEDDATMRDAGRNGTYLVMRHLEQDVRAFWQFVDEQAGAVAVERDKLAEAMVGRTLSGDPLVPASQAIEGIDTSKPEAAKNQFTYEADPAALRCPYGAHVRRANPRTADYPGQVHRGFDKLVHQLGLPARKFRDDLVASTRFHRILRRGREYGPGLPPQDALRPAPFGDPKRGLHFMCLNANIARQFEFVQNAWLMSSKFNAMSGETDPLMGNREPIPGSPVTSGFSIPRDNGVVSKVSGLPHFVRVRGGAYFFLPGLRALRYFVKAGV